MLPYPIDFPVKILFIPILDQADQHLGQTTSDGCLFYNCNICNYQHVQKGIVKNHIEAKHLSLSFFCKYCDHKCNSSGGIRVHMFRKHKFQWKCIFFLDVTDSIESRLIKVQSGWQCHDCSYFSSSSSTVRRHIESKHLNIFYNCEVCGKQAPTKHALYMHKSRNHPGHI